MSQRPNIVRRIFRELANGGTATNICDRLDAEGIPAPGKNKHGEPGLWCTSAIGRIVREGIWGIGWLTNTA